MFKWDNVMRAWLQRPVEREDQQPPLSGTGSPPSPRSRDNNPLLCIIKPRLPCESCGDVQSRQHRQSFCLDFDLSCKNDCRHLWNKVQLSSILNWFSELVEKVYSVVRSQNYSVTLCAVHANAGSSKALPRYSLGQTTLHCNTVYGTHGLTVPAPRDHPALLCNRPGSRCAQFFCSPTGFAN